MYKARGESSSTVAYGYNGRVQDGGASGGEGLFERYNHGECRAATLMSYLPMTHAVKTSAYAKIGRPGERVVQYQNHRSRPRGQQGQNSLPRHRVYVASANRDRH